MEPWMSAVPYYGLESATLRINRPLNLYSDHLDFRPTQPTFLTCNWQSLFVPKGVLVRE